MTEPRGPRPLTYADLPDYRSQDEQIAELDSPPLGNGVWTAVENLVAALRCTYDTVNVEQTNGRIRLTRPKSETELDSALTAAQRDWDHKRQLADEATDREALEVGDPYAATTSVLRCRECSLSYDHHGDHVTVEDGRITAFSPRK